MKYIAIDIETTGLDPTKDRILELAYVVLNADLNEYEHRSWVIRCSVLSKCRMSDYVRSMHTSSGLLTSPLPMNSDRIEEILCDVVRDYEWDDGKPILIGSTVHFDRSFLRHWMPAFEEILHHRHYDANAARFAGIPEPEFVGTKHRALPDIQHSIEWLRDLERSVNYSKALLDGPTYFADSIPDEDIGGWTVDTESDVMVAAYDDGPPMMPDALDRSCRILEGFLLEDDIAHKGWFNLCTGIEAWSDEMIGHWEDCHLVAETEGWLDITTEPQEREPTTTLRRAARTTDR